MNLRSSKSGLIFDTARGGAGENVAQPLEVAEGRAYLKSTPFVTDGAQEVCISIRSLEPGATILLTVDVDDSVPPGPRGVQMISGSEIAGAAVALDVSNGGRVSASFDCQGNLRLPLSACS